LKLILGSSSPFRKELLSRLHLKFECCSPDIDETQRPGEEPAELVERLSREKAQEVEKSFDQALIISSDQVAVHNNKILGKPGTHENAIQQLSAFSGQSVQFMTGLCLYNSNSKVFQYYQDTTWVRFRSLSHKQIDNYLIMDKPYQCAGSFKSEGLGAALFESIESLDPNALIGLPIIKLVEMLNNEGVDVLAI